ncbi:MAG: hypothetical protein AVDCRST_MAG12-1025, partial [uncultured Rubrobacteraceae bacterium]
ERERRARLRSTDRPALPGRYPAGDVLDAGRGFRGGDRQRDAAELPGRGRGPAARAARDPGRRGLPGRVRRTLPFKRARCEGGRAAIRRRVLRPPEHGPRGLRPGVPDVQGRPARCLPPLRPRSRRRV